MGILQDWTTDPTEGFTDTQIRSFQKVLDLMIEKLDADPRYLIGCNLNVTASKMGKLGGSAKTEAKSSASRENGKLGGRPRKVKPE